ncbi:O-acetyl-ADP-ribose deacetylase [Cellulomonas wangsupingiae]|uniref:O-acetyl-ADP-ribose deacetylase n=1 Tax=Cellulomonas wangsupingiae TaxID=2968085 RepID=UPI001D0EC88F|nr:O-acetyl-ADP-ribose deacetylase [Cellulomonas wangsupingiae]MCM0640866.1 O-acetyl-ADP-ribose deacetylase [Cellulomonas wangsupingiae]
MGIETVLGDITQQDVDVVVNAANSSLLGGAGVDGAIHRAAGPRLLSACRELRATTLPAGLPVGQAVATPGFDLPARWVVHTVGPNRYRGETDPGLLASCVTSSLDVAAGLGAASVALPAVSAGAYGWDAAEAAEVAVGAARGWLDGHAGSSVRTVRFVLFSPPVLAAFDAALAAHGATDRAAR